MPYGRRRIFHTPQSAASGGGAGGTVGNVAWGPDFGGTDGDQFSVAVDITELSVSMQTTNKITTKDSWVDDLTVCGGDLNHDATPLEVEGTVATKKNALIGWDVSGFQSGMTVTSLTLRLVLDTAPLLVNQTITVSTIPTADEGWTEANVRCSNDPEPETSVGSFTVNAADAVGTVYTITIDATGRARLANRMGTSSFTLALSNADAVTGVNCKFEDKDTGAAGDTPRITFTATKTLTV